MKKIACFMAALVILLSVASVAVSATYYTGFDIVFEEKDGA